MDRVFDFYKRLALPVNILLSGLSAVALYAWMWRVFPAIVWQNQLELQFSFTIPRAINIIAQWGPEGIDAYLGHLWLDFIFPLAYAACLTGVLVFLHLHKRIRLTIRGLAWCSLPMLAMVCDEIENALHFFMFPTGWIPNETVLWFASMASVLKWLLVLASLGKAGALLLAKTQIEIKGEKA